VPKTKTVASSTKDWPIITVSKGGETYLGSSPVSLLRLADQIHQRYPGQTTVYLKADRVTQFDPIAQVLAALGDAKINVSVVTQPEDTGGNGRR